MPYDDMFGRPANHNQNYQNPQSQPRQQYPQSQNQNFNKQSKFQPLVYQGLYLPYSAMANVGIDQETIDALIQIAIKLSEKGFTLRTGADGKQGELFNPLGYALRQVSSKCEMYLPWKGFNNEADGIASKDIAKDMLAELKPATATLPNAVRAILSNYTHVLTGKMLNSHTKFFLTWTEDGVESIGDITPKTGNMATPILICSRLNIPVFNVRNPESVERLQRFIKLFRGPTNDSNSDSNTRTNHPNPQPSRSYDTPNQTRNSNYDIPY